MKTCKLALIGFGNVGQGFAQILRDQQETISALGLNCLIVAVSDLHKGSIYQPQGFSPADLLQAVKEGSSLENLPAQARGWSAEETIRQSGADVLVELSYTDLQTGEPATGHVRLALQEGMHVITTNKGPVALHYPALQALAQQKGLKLGIEGTVMSGTPSMQLGGELLAGAGVFKIQGILNGTTNYILSQMETGAPYAEALAGAQQKGYAEADPTGDVEGYDAAGKVVILANVLMGASLTLSQIQREGITRLTPADIQSAQAAGERWKLIASLEKTPAGEILASVRPTRLPQAHPLASVGGATNAITFSTALLGDVTLIGPGAGRLATGYAILSDLLAIYRA
jgi:homoserine dehydrogenase